MTMMNKLPNISINCRFPESGFWYKAELDIALLFLKLKEDFGIDFQPVIIPFLIKLNKKMIRVLELTQKNQALTSEEEKELVNLKEQEKKLAV